MALFSKYTTVTYKITSHGYAIFIFSIIQYVLSQDINVKRNLQTAFVVNVISCRSFVVK